LNAKTKKRMIVVTGVIVMVLILILAIVGGSTAAKTIGVADAASGQYVDQRVQVTGNVVENSYTTTGNVLTFSIYDPDSEDGVTLNVSYDGAAASTFGNDVTAICTGKIGDDGVLYASEMVTKCPSKYESGTEALTVDRMMGYGSDITGTTVRVTGKIQAGSQNAAGQGDRFVLEDADTGATVSVLFDGAVSEETLADGASVVLTGNLTEDGKFSATNVALAE
jgi:cytochrome c-type biogenesis protein CcmE